MNVPDNVDTIDHRTKNRTVEMPPQHSVLVQRLMPAVSRNKQQSHPVVE
jgi:hypothetical protein